MRTAADGRLLELAADLKDSRGRRRSQSVHVADVLAATADAPAMPWAAVRRRMLEYGFEMTTCDFTGLWAAVGTPDSVRALERVMWHRYGPKPTDQIIARTVNRRISGPLTRQLLRTGLGPHVATVLAFVTTLLAAGLIAVGEWWAMAAGGLGAPAPWLRPRRRRRRVARVSGRASRRGAALDTLLDRYADLAVVVGLVIGAGHTETAGPGGSPPGAAAC